MNSWTKQVQFLIISEDNLLQQFYIQSQSFKKWKQISDKFLALGIQKSVYECRQRYINKLDPTIKNEKWTNKEIQSLFMFYRLNGSKWQKMQTILPQRTQGQLKNKFYSFLRSFILKALQQSKQLKSFKVNSLSSKNIKRLFEGAQEFAQFYGKMTEYLEVIEYEISSQRIQQLLNKREYQIKQIFKILFQNSKKPKSKQTSHTQKYAIQKRDSSISSQKLMQNSQINSDEESLSKNHSQKIQKLQKISEKQNSQNPLSKFQQSKIQSKLSENLSKPNHMTNSWGIDKDIFSKMDEGRQQQVMDANNWMDWTKYQYQLPFYGMQNCMSRYQPEQDETIVSRLQNMFYYCMPFNGQQQYYYHL